MSMGRVSADRDGIWIGPRGENADADKQAAHARKARKRGIMGTEKSYHTAGGRRSRERVSDDTPNSLIRFCNSCGAAVTHRIPDGDTLARAVCDVCGTIHYQNPKLVVGCLPVHGDRILICKRAIEPRYGLWTLPAGFMENEESASAGAAREALEEANARVEIEDLYTVFSIPHISQVYMMFRARLLDPDVSPGAESLEVKLVTEDEVPWDQLAFAMVKRTLEHFFEDRKRGRFVTRFGDIRKMVSGSK
jgi:ADP-ribose pyrophosphatase YjhB (NUDIX family)